METMSFSPHHPARSRVGTRLVAAIALVALLSLTGCASEDVPKPKVTVTITPGVTPTPVATEPEPDPDPIVTPEPDPDPIVTPEPEPEPEPEPNITPSTSGGLTLGVSQGGVAAACTHSTCWYLQLEWEGLTKGSHQVQCASDALTPNVFSDNSYYFDTTSGERELKCFVGHPGSHVWVVIDGLYSSNHVTWG